jgi:hypothetical protein
MAPSIMKGPSFCRNHYRRVVQYNSQLTLIADPLGKVIYNIRSSTADYFREARLNEAAGAADAAVSVFLSGSSV